MSIVAAVVRSDRDKLVPSADDQRPSNPIDSRPTFASAYLPIDCHSIVGTGNYGANIEHGIIMYATTTSR